MTETDKRAQIKAFLAEADAKIEAARSLAAAEGIDNVYWDGPTYGMGGWITSGEWAASSNSC